MTQTAETQAPSTFVSYSWDSTAHIDWVLQLATRLRTDGVGVVLDGWDIQLGSDLSLFMERAGDTAYRVLAIRSRRDARAVDARRSGQGRTRTIRLTMHGHDVHEPLDPRGGPVVRNSRSRY